jgi:hypothetical protein
MNCSTPKKSYYLNIKQPVEFAKGKATEINQA